MIQRTLYLSRRTSSADPRRPAEDLTHSRLRGMETQEGPGLHHASPALISLVGPHACRRSVSVTVALTAALTLAAAVALALAAALAATVTLAASAT